MPSVFWGPRSGMFTGLLLLLFYEHPSTHAVAAEKRTLLWSTTHCPQKSKKNPLTLNPK